MGGYSQQVSTARYSSRAMAWVPVHFQMPLQGRFSGSLTNFLISQVPGHVPPHAVISPVLSQPAITPDSTMATPPRGSSKTRDRWPLPPLPQRTPVHGRERDQEAKWGTLSWGGDLRDDSGESRLMSDAPAMQADGRRGMSSDRGRPARRALKDNDGDSQEQVQGWQDDAVVEQQQQQQQRYSRPYRDDEMLDAAHQRIQQRKDAEERLQERLIGHLGQLPSRRETELARAARAPLDAPPRKDPAEVDPKSPAALQRALEAAGMARCAVGLVVGCTLAPDASF